LRVCSKPSGCIRILSFFSSPSSLSGFASRSHKRRDNVHRREGQVRTSPLFTSVSWLERSVCGDVVSIFDRDVETLIADWCFYRRFFRPRPPLPRRPPLPPRRPPLRRRLAPRPPLPRPLLASLPVPRPPPLSLPLPSPPPRLPLPPRPRPRLPPPPRLPLRPPSPSPPP
jgi:hypothetical protein